MSDPVHIHTPIYIRYTATCVRVCVCMFAHTCAYLYQYKEREKEREHANVECRLGVGEWGRDGFTVSVWWCFENFTSITEACDSPRPTPSPSPPTTLPPRNGCMMFGLGEWNAATRREWMGVVGSVIIVSSTPTPKRYRGSGCPGGRPPLRLRLSTESVRNTSAMVGRWVATLGGRQKGVGEGGRVKEVVARCSVRMCSCFCAPRMMCVWHIEITFRRRRRRWRRQRFDDGACACACCGMS